MSRTVRHAWTWTEDKSRMAVRGGVRDGEVDRGAYGRVRRLGFDFTEAELQARNRKNRRDGREQCRNPEQD